jgi:tetratricopeptide (TPR) repeat protein
MTSEHEDHQEIDQLLRGAVDCALAAEDFGATLARFRERLPGLAPGLIGRMPDEGMQRAFALGLFREVWRVLPRPERGWRPLPLPKIERNGPCPCGSGRKHKQCCAQLDTASLLGEGLSVLAYVLERIPVADYPKLPFKLISPEELAHVADQWRDEGRHEAAIALLEPLLADVARLGERHEAAFDALCDLYMDIDRDDLRLTLVEAVMGAPDRTVRVAAIQRRCTIHADAGEHEAAWRLFHEAQRLDPDSPALANLELVMLANQNRVQELGARARFWAARLRKLGYEGEDFLTLIDDIVRSPESFIESMNQPASAGRGELEGLAASADTLPAPLCHYQLQAMGDSAGPLEPVPALATIEREWRDLTGDDWQPWRETGWIDWLNGTPLAWQSFAILDDLMSAVDEYEFEAEDEGELLDDIENAVLDHAVALLRLVVAESRAESLKLEWGWIENRPALRLLARKIEIEAGTDEEVPLLEWLLALNPNDNLGIRERLVHVYCAHGRPAEALAVCDRYPGDGLVGTLYGRVLALVLLDRRADATVALAAATKYLPRVLKTLTAARPKQPKLLDRGFVTAGGEDEAWLYRQQWRAVWQSTGALDWLKRAAGGKG